ncbi:MAG: DUF2269 family protein [Acidimicrobiales bacterium]
MGIDTGAYKFVEVLHVLAVVVGFGGIVVGGIFGAKAKSRGGAGGQAAAEVAFDVTEHWSQWFIYAVPVLGILLVLMSDDSYKFSQAWISISFLLYIVFVGLMHGLHLPNIRRMNELITGAGADDVAELDARAKKAGVVGGALNLIWVVVVFLMVFQPGR